MSDDINLASLAALLGMPVGNLQQQVRQTHLGRLGQPRGREKALVIGDYAVARMCTEFQAPARSINEVFEMCVGLIPHLEQQINGELDHDTYALLLEGTGTKPPREYLFCDGWAELAGHVADALAKGWPRFQVVNLKEVAQEIVIGWCFATGKAEQLAANFRKRLDVMPPAEIKRTEELLALFHKRLASRPNPPAPVSIVQPPSAGEITANGTWTLAGVPTPVQMPSQSPAKVKA